MLERYFVKDFYYFVAKIKIPCENRFKKNSKELKHRISKFKDLLFLGSKSYLKENVILNKFSRNPFKDSKYDEIGIKIKIY